MELLLFLLVIPLLFLILFRKHRKNGMILPPPPGPSGLPVIGNLHQLDTSAFHHHLWLLSKKYGPLMSLKLGFVPTLVVSSAKIAKEVLKTNDLEFSGRPNFLSQQKLSYNGFGLTFAPYGEYWREMRKICVLHLFGPNRVQSFSSIREEEVSRMIKTISNSASDSELAITNLSELLLSLTSSIICRIAFGKRYGTDHEIEGCGRSKYHSLLSEVQAVAGSFSFSDYFPYLGCWIDKLTGQYSWIDKTCKELDLFLQEIIDEHLDERRAKDDQEANITDILLQLQTDSSFTIDLTLDRVKALLMDMFVAGTDTSAAALVWAMTELIRNSRVMNRVQEEVRSMFGSEEGRIAESDVQELTYLKAVVKETLRLHPPAPLMVPHETTQKCKVSGYEIGPKTVVYVNVWAIGRDNECWENPEEFIPERFLGNSIDFKGQNFELIPFGAGRRGCPGMHLAVATVELALANLVYSFDWELPAGMKEEDIGTEVKPGITMHKRDELCLLARKFSGKSD